VTEDQYLFQLARLLTRREDQIRSEVRGPLLEVLLRLRALLLTLFAPGTSAPLRSFLYAQLRPQIRTTIQPLANAYFTLIRTALPPVHTDLRTLNTTFFRLPPNTFPTPTLTLLLTGATVLKRPARTLLAPGPTGLSPLTLQLERLLDASIQAAILRDAPAEAVATLLLTGTTSRPTIRKGTVANAWLDRLTATTSSLLWSLNPPLQQEAATASTSLPSAVDRPLTGWRWNAVLDPKTCPICRPLHNTLAATPDDFPSGPPPLHPYCRCVTIPLY
jgi:hypothetical protein